MVDSPDNANAVCDAANTVCDAASAVCDAANGREATPNNLQEKKFFGPANFFLVRRHCKVWSNRCDAANAVCGAANGVCDAEKRAMYSKSQVLPKAVSAPGQ